MNRVQIIKTALASFVLLSVFSCSGPSVDKMLQKKWQVSEFKDKNIDEELNAAKTKADTTQDPMMKEEADKYYKMLLEIMESIKKTTYEFKADSVFELTSFSRGESKTGHGKWFLADNDKKIIAKINETERQDTMMIDEINEEKLVLSTKGRDGNISIIFKAVK